MEIIEHKTFDEERALYGMRDIDVRSSSFDGPADGESAFKECINVSVSDCYFNLRYPFWHDHVLSIKDSEMTEACRAALWYSDHIEIRNTKMHGIKALRECSDVYIADSDIISPEFGWSVHDITMENSRAESEYFMMRSTDLRFRNVNFTGKYSFQYIENALFENCEFNTKDAFWHSKNVTVKDSIVNGEYLAWYSEGLTLINCRIKGTQPFCYCSNLRLVNCSMEDTDLAFEKSTVDAEITTPVISIKNPRGGVIRVPAVSEIIMDDKEAEGKIEII
ncbi:MAG: DUF3737 family protein [Spirochaetes bacterium]|uniref:DUF3737 family protein n=1 Tax=Candidatus Ornithospirochaeta stercoravium TaxID=2840897 RepID=A0A9D9NDE3_9SPIO|nr:DUF3737 family protein [Candidatus Ornithospirochaeta stercoravium]